jgi:hypothetical protein
VTTLVPPGKTYTQEQKDAALALYETDGPTAVEKQLGIPKNTVAGWARKAGTRTVRPERTRAAVEAKVLDGKSRRASIVNRLYARAEHILDRLEAEKYTYTVTTKESVEKVEDYDPPAGDERNLATSIAVYLDKATKLEDYDRAGNESGAAVDQWLDMMTGGLRGGSAAGG